MERVRIGVVLGLACLLAGAGPFLVSDPSVRRLAAAAAFSLPAVAPFFFGGRETGIAAGIVALGLVTFASLTVGAEPASRALLVRNLELASAGALGGGLLAGMAWARDILRSASAE